jgi:hypothetical protein
MMQEARNKMQDAGVRREEGIYVTIILFLQDFHHLRGNNNRLAGSNYVLLRYVKYV